MSVPTKNKTRFTSSKDKNFFIFLCFRLIAIFHSMTNSGVNSKPLNILQWNCRSLNTTHDQLVQFLSDSDHIYDALVFQSIGSTSLSLPSIPEFHYPPYISISNSRIRNATYVRKGLQSSRLYVNDFTVGHAVSVEIKDEEPVIIVNAYLPEGVSSEDDIKWLKNLNSGRILVCGDFNCHSPLWDSSLNKSDKGGSCVEEILENIDLCILNDGTITRIPEVLNHKSSAIDLTFTSSNLYLKTSWDVLDDPLGSDHLPIHIMICNTPDTLLVGKQPNFIYDKADWSKFRCLLETYIYPENYQDVDEWYSGFQSLVLSAAIKSIPMSNGKNSPKKKINEWWNENCRKERAVYRKLVRKYKQNRSTTNLEILRKQKILYNKTLAEAKVSFWSNYVQDNVQSYRDSNTLYRKLRSVKGRYDPPDQPFLVDGKKITNPLEKVEVLASTFAAVSQNSSLTTEQLNHRINEEAKFSTPQFTESEADQKFTAIELNRALFGIKKVKKSTGVDPVSYSMIKRFPNKTKQALLQYFNYLWQSGSMPKVWREAHVSAIPKPGKPKKDPKSYRPIALTPHVSKLYERLVKNRLEFFLENNNLIPKCQSGFRRGRSCTENLVKFSSHVKRAMMRRRPVLATFYDIKRAYDTVWHKKLLQKLYDIGVSQNMYNFFCKFLEKRVIRVAIGDAVSKPYVLDMGIPQGSIVAPTAFSIMLSDINKLKLNRSCISLYADDLAMWTTARYRRTDINYFFKNELACFQSNVNTIVNYMENNGFTLSPEKTTFMVFTSARVSEEVYIEIYNTKIHTSKEVKYLGVIFDKIFSFDSHIKHLIQKTRKNLNLIKLMKKENGLNDINLMRNLVISLVRSRLTYGQEIFYSAPSTYLAKLQRTETSIIKTIFNIPQTANPLLVYREIGIKPLNFTRRLQTTKTFFRLGCSENDVDKEIDPDFNDSGASLARNNKLKRPLIFSKSISITSYSQFLIDKADLGGTFLECIPQCKFPYAPWEENHIDVVTDFGELNKSDHGLLLSTLSHEKIDELSSEWLLVYTDGSIDNSGQTGCAFVIPQFNITQKFRLKSGISIFSAEMYAIEQALIFCRRIVNCPKICILSDSRSALQAIKNRSDNRVESIFNILSLIQEFNLHNIEILLHWIPSHTGIPGNEHADKAAKDAATNDSLPLTDIPLTFSEASSKLKKANDELWQIEFENYAKDLEWCNPNLIQIPRFVAPPKYLYAFLRFRCKSTRFDIYQIDCVCQEASLSVSHIFQCPVLLRQLLLTKTYCSKENLELSYLGVMSYHPSLGWTPAKTFIFEILESDIGYLL